MLRRLVIAVIAAAIAAVFLLATDQRLLVWETKPAAGGYECRYFTGRAIVTTTHPAGEGCPFLTSNSEVRI
jgi:hypothetical protein